MENSTCSVCSVHKNTNEQFSYLFWNDTRKMFDLKHIGGVDDRVTTNSLFFLLAFSAVLVYVSLKMTPTKFQVSKFLGQLLFDLPLGFKKLFCFLMGLAILPIFGLTMILCILYRMHVHLLLKWNNMKYLGLMQGPDVMWSMDTPNARSIINVLVMIDVDKSKSPDQLLKLFQNIAKKSFLCLPSAYPKLTYLRQKGSLGYHYWQACSHLDVETFVRPFFSNYTVMSESALKEIIGDQCNKPLPLDDKATWEILVGQLPLISTVSAHQYPVIFRVHHSVGDGVTLVRILLEGLADHSPHKDCGERRKAWASTANSHASIQKTNSDGVNVAVPACHEFLIKPQLDLKYTSTSTPTSLNKSGKVCEEKLRSVSDIVKNLLIHLTVGIIVVVVCGKRSLQMLISRTAPTISCFLQLAFSSPYVIVHQMIGKTDDKILYGRPLTGEKTVSWITEETDGEKESQLLTKIRKIRSDHGKTTKFTHVLFTCLSRSLEKFYRLKALNTPQSINVVLPARVDYDDLTKGLQTTAKVQVGCLNARVTRLYGTRRNMKPEFRTQHLSFSSSTDSDADELRIQRRVEKLHATLSKPLVKNNFKLGNKFTVAMINLPIPAKSSSFAVDLTAVQKSVEELRHGPDYLINYWLLRWVAHLLPVPLLNPFLASAPCSLVLSNLPGPVEIVQLCGNPIRSIAFWVPNRGLTGVGIGMLSYCGRFSMGIMADKSLMSGEEAHNVLAGIFEEINSCYDGRFP